MDNSNSAFDLSAVAASLSLSVHREGDGESTASNNGSDDSFAAQGSVVGADLLQQDNQSEATTGSRGLSLATKKELVLAIEARGGIERCTTKKLLEDLPEFAANPKFKTAVGNKISRWKNSYRHEYEKLKLSFAVDLAQQQPDLIGSNIAIDSSTNHRRGARASPSRASPSPVHSAVHPPTVHSLAPVHHLPRQHLTPPHPNPPRPNLPRPTPPSYSSPAEHIAYSAPTPRPFVPLPAGIIMNNIQHALVASAELIQVNVGMPEKNKPFMVVPFRDHELPNGRVATGYIIELHDKDPRFMMTKFTGTDVPSFEAFHLGGNEVLVKIPSTSFTFIHDEAAEAKGLTDAGLLDKSFTQPLTVTRNAIVRDVSRHFVSYRLVFPVALDNDVLCSGAENNIIAPKLVPIVSQYEVATSNGTAKITSYRTNVHWKIAVHEVELRSTKHNKKKNELDDQATTLFGKFAPFGPVAIQQAASTLAIQSAPVESDSIQQKRTTAPSVEERDSKRSAAAATTKLVAVSAQSSMPAVKSSKEKRERVGKGPPKPTTEELSRESRLSDSEKIRGKKKKEKLQFVRSQPQKHSSLQALAEAEKPAQQQQVQEVLLDPHGRSVSQAQLDEMVAKWANKHGKSLSEAQQELERTTNPQDFVSSFYELLNDMSEAWREPEKEVSFEGGDQVDGDDDKDIDMSDL